MSKCSNKLGYGRLRGLLLAVITVLMPVVHGQETEKTVIRSDAREPAFAKVLFYYYQNKPYDALAGLLANPKLSFNATGSINVMLGDLYSKYGLTREADVAVSRSVNSDVTASNRNDAWLHYGKLLYRTKQYELGLNFLSKPPIMLSPLQESERVVMLANMMMQASRQPEAIDLLSKAQTSSPYYYKLLKYNYALALLQKNNAELEKQEAAATKNKRSKAFASKVNLNKGAEALAILESLQQQTKTTKKEEDSSWALWRSKPSTNVPEFKEDLSVTPVDHQNLDDKIALSTAYLYLQQGKPQKAKNVLRTIRLDSAHSNTALLTSAHVYYQLKDYPLAFNFAAELGKRNGADPLVQEGWLLAARAIEETDPNKALQYYELIIALLRQQYANLNEVQQSLLDLNIMQEFRVVDSDPILIALPDIRRNQNAGIWAFLLDNGEIMRALQQVRQTYLLEQKLHTYIDRVAKLQQQPTAAANMGDINKLATMTNRLGVTLTRAKVQDQAAFVALAQEPLQERQDKVDFYLTEALLGKQRVQNWLKER